LSLYIILSWCGSLLCIQWLSSPPWMALFSAQVALFECRIHLESNRGFLCYQTWSELWNV